MTFEKIDTSWRARGAKQNLAVLRESDIDQLRAVLVGRKVVEVIGNPKPGEMGEESEGHLLLDDGTVLKIVPNEGCGGCSSGWYYLTALNTVDNVITNVEQITETTDEYGEAHVYRVFVFAEERRLDLFTVSGDDGNGYYGSGYEIFVRAAS